MINTGGTFTIKANDDTSKTATVTLTKYTAPATCDCSCMGISCNPTTAMTNESTIVLLTYCDNCSKGWTAYNSSGTKVDSGNSGDTFKPSSMGQYTIVSDACTAKTCTFTVYKEITLTWSGSFNKLWTNGESNGYGCDNDGDGVNELYLPSSTLFTNDRISYSISNFSGSYSDISVTANATRFHLGFEKTGTTSYTLSSSSGTLITPSCVDTVSDEICKQVEQAETITSYSASYIGTDFYKIKEIDNVEYIDEGI